MHLAAFVAVALAAWIGLDEETQPPSDMREVARQAASDLNAGRCEAAAHGFQSIAEKHPDSLYAWSHLGLARMQQDNPGEACRAFRHAVRLSPQDAGLQANLGFCYFEQRKYEAAIDPLERAENLNSGNSNVHALLARCYEQTGREREARHERETENLQQIEMYR